MADRAARPLDKAIGTVIRQHRLLAGYSQQTLAGTLGITYQQIHKYERGHNRITASRLVEIAAALHITPTEVLQDAIQLSGTATAPPERDPASLALTRAVARLPRDMQAALAALARTPRDMQAALAALARTMDPHPAAQETAA